MQNNTLAYMTKVDPLRGPITLGKDADNIIKAYSYLKTKASIEDLLKLGIDARNDSDLYYNKSILVSTGWNLNDDVFDNYEVWNARHTAEDKPSNLDHDEKQIVGHITGNWPIDEFGNVIAEDTEIIPDYFHLFTSNVIYLHWEDPAYKDKVLALVKAIEDGEMFVSMEALFSNFDYACVYPSGENKVIARENQTSFLSKYLRAYGGSGIYNGAKIGRLLRGISFSGKGYVRQPANPKSIIFAEKDFIKFISKSFVVKNEFCEKLGVSITETDSIGSTDMNLEQLTKEVEELKAALAEAQTVKAELEKKLASTDASDKIAALEAQLAEAKAKCDDDEKKMKDHEEDAKKAKSELEAALAKIAEFEAKAAEDMKKEKFGKRKAQLLEVGVSEEEADITVAKFENISDEDFGFIATLAGRSSKKEEQKVESSTAEEILDEVVEEETTTLSVDATETIHEKDDIQNDLVKIISSRLGRNKKK